VNRFVIAIEYLTGYAVATDHANREKAEWPPHPARVFMALAAAHFETDGPAENKAAERAALEWLAMLGEPALALPEQGLPEHLSPRVNPTVYVPVNDARGVDVLPTKRSRQPRVFPRVYVGDHPVRLVWSIAPDSQEHVDALESLCQKVTRIGHSSSLVWVRLERELADESVTHESGHDAMDFRLRVTGEGALDRLRQAFNEESIEAYYDLAERVDAAKGNERKSLQQQQARQFPQGPPTSQRPTFPVTLGYRRVQPAQTSTPHSPFDPSLIVLKEAEDNPQGLGAESTLLVTSALRGTIQALSPVQPMPDWVSGHSGPNGPKLADGRGHMAIIPLPFVGREHADGRLMGLAIVMPRDVPLRERARVLSPVLFDEKTNEPRTLKLTMGRAGVFHVERETSFSTKLNLQPITWTRASRIWASVTPVALDRMPKADRANDRQAWINEVAGIVSQSCANQQLPVPIAVRVEKTPFFVGSPRAMPGQGGFPLLRPGTFQVHVAIDFGVEVQGPILLGAGRFRGYGLCRPWSGEVSQ
jgi:CRISPR-associated protein Csb2